MALTTEDFPQADRLMQVGQVALAVAAGNYEDGEIERFIALESDGRQGRYYRKAAELIGLVVNAENHSKLTARGREYAALEGEVAQRAYLAQCLLGVPLFSKAIAHIAAQRPAEAELRDWFAAIYPGAANTAQRRYSTFIRWLEETRLAAPAGARRLPGAGYAAASAPAMRPLSGGIAGKPGVAPALVQVEIDWQKHERANEVHAQLVAAKTSFLRTRGWQATQNELIDVFCDHGGEAVIYEMKSTTADNFSAQIRKAVAQLYEYRYLFGVPQARLAIVTDAPLPARQDWLAGYLGGDRGIAYVWTENFAEFHCLPEASALLGPFAPQGRKTLCESGLSAKPAVSFL